MHTTYFAVKTIVLLGASSFAPSATDAHSLVCAAGVCLLGTIICAVMRT